MVCACLAACMDPIVLHDWPPRQQSLARKARLKICSPSVVAARFLGDKHLWFVRGWRCRQSCSWVSSEWPRDQSQSGCTWFPHPGKPSMRVQSETSFIFQREYITILCSCSLFFLTQLEDGVQIRSVGGCIIDMCYGKLVCQPELGDPTRRNAYYFPIYIWNERS